jgi:hypothetical protein
MRMVTIYLPSVPEEIVFEPQYLRIFIYHEKCRINRSASLRAEVNSANGALAPDDDRRAGR